VLTQVSVVPPAGAFWSPLAIPVLAPDSGGIFIEKVDGLDPVQAEITTNAYQEQDGEFYVGSRAVKRNIVLHTILENRDITVSDARRQLYGYFMPKMSVLLQLDFSDRDSVQIPGYVESFEGDRWSSDPDAAISIICPKPNFLSEAQFTVTGNSEVGTDPELTDVLNEGDRAVGFELWIANDSGVDFSGDIRIQSIVERPTGVYFSLQEMRLDNVDLPGASTDYVYVNTKQGLKVAQLIDPSPDPDVVTSLLGKMTDDSAWPVLYSAMNRFRVITTGTTGWGTNHLDWTLKYYYEFGGV
jgi:hypothetical protein